jgi:hypothetical protein
VSVFSVPPLEDTPWPSLGWQLVPWMEENLVFGPGDLRGQPLRLDDERKALIYRMYEVYPQGHPNVGRRRFRRCAISVRKGVGKTELAALIACAELSPSAPVRCVGWDDRGRPVGGSVTDPYVPLVAYTEEQSEDLAYGAMKAVLEESPLAHEFDIGIERIMRRSGDGKAVALASAPDARDGARTTFSVADETHRWTLPRLRQAHRVMLANLPKRRMADPWALETTTSYAPGEGSVAEQTMEYAREVERGEKADARLFFFHRQASDGHDLTTTEGVRAAVLEASGPTAGWSDVDGIVEQFDDPTADRNYLERVWLNRVTKSARSAFDLVRWAELVHPAPAAPADRARIVLAFCGARYSDAAALVGTEISTGYQWLVASWEAPARTKAKAEDLPAWEVSPAAVDDAVAAAFKRWRVWRLYATPTHWEETVSDWAGRYDGDKEARVISWRTNQRDRMSRACRAFDHALKDGSMSHDGSDVLKRHIGACCQRVLQIPPDEHGPWWIVQKASADSLAAINAGVAAILAWQARLDALEKGIGARSVYEEREPTVLGGGAAAGELLDDEGVPYEDGWAPLGEEEDQP